MRGGPTAPHQANICPSGVSAGEGAWPGCSTAIAVEMRHTRSGLMERPVNKA